MPSGIPCPGPLGYGSLEEGSARPWPSEGPARVAEPEQGGETSPVDFQAWDPEGYSRLEEGSASPGPSRSLGSRLELSEHHHAWVSSPDPVPGALPLGGLEGKAQNRGSNLEPAGAHEPKLTGEASLGWVDPQAWAPQGMAGWRKGAPNPGHGRGPAGVSELEVEVEASPAWRTPRPRLLMVRRLEEGSARPRVRQGPGAWSELSEHSHAWESASEPALGALPPGGPDDKAHYRGSQPEARRLEEGSARPRAQLGPGAHLGLSEHSHAGEASQAPCHPAGWRTELRTGVPKPGPTRDLARGPSRAPELEPEEDASLGPTDSQASPTQGTAG
ncbi:hypothetical protein NDU88_007527 [Pleurodeles waltl]|uniref:Uncharacterized protein n=1 Tax=Pleurodeles waltl TaxID=8319 RepID=A0AAV7VT53_PLEWA|nr:hypothetical protein NDU88_007527 [Pleurodeles waltl]